LTLSSCDGRQLIELDQDRTRCRDQIDDQSLVHVQIALVFTEIANVMTPGA